MSVVESLVLSDAEAQAHYSHGAVLEVIMSVIHGVEVSACAQKSVTASHQNGAAMPEERGPRAGGGGGAVSHCCCL